jgi:uncharacterized protein GlcG (DUF336 family)
MTVLTLAQSSIIADKALELARELKMRPITIAVLDAGGQFKVIKREDGSSLLRSEIAIGKAWGCLGMGFGGRELARRVKTAPTSVLAWIAASDGRMTASPAGGVIIRDNDDEIIGAVGVTGSSADNDERCAVHGITSAGLKADTGADGWQP